MVNVTVGHFKVENGSFYGPAEFMKERGSQDLNTILAGKNQVFNSMASMSPNIETAICVFMQTYYAEWKGMCEMMSWTK